MFVRQRVDQKSCAEYTRWKDASLFLQTYAHAEESTEKGTQRNPYTVPAKL